MKGAPLGRQRDRKKREVIGEKWEGLWCNLNRRARWPSDCASLE
jgi:hypothetical protein